MTYLFNTHRLGFGGGAPLARYFRGQVGQRNLCSAQGSLFWDRHMEFGGVDVTTATSQRPSHTLAMPKRYQDGNSLS